jgi:putative membrane protein
MTVPEPTPADPGERRLHPMSWLFVMLEQMRTFLLPLLAFVLFGRTDRNELWSAVVLCILVAVSIWRYLTYVYRIEDDSVMIRSGLLERTLRQIPFSRIHNVAVHQTLLHRLFGVAEVRLESAGGHKPEAEMRVLRLDDAEALEALVRRSSTRASAGAATPGDVDAAAAPAASAVPLLAMPRGDVLRLGLISNRGMLVFGAALVAVSQLHPQLPPDMARRWGGEMNRTLAHLDPAALGLVFVAFAIGFLLLLRGLSVLLALLQYSGFRLEQQGRRLTVERGLLTRLRTSVARRRIQAYRLEETVLHRLFARRSLKVDTAVAGHHHDDRSFHELAPVATAAACDTLLRHLLPDNAWPPAAWRPLHARAWWRIALPRLLLIGAIACALCWRYGHWGAIVLAAAPVAAAVAWRQARSAGYAVNDRLVAMREGWWSRQWRFAEIDKLQTLQLRRSPLDRALGMATLSLDTAGADPRTAALHLRFLTVAEAREILERLRHAVAIRRLRW